MDLVKSFSTNIWLRKVDVDTAVNEPLKFRSISKLRDSIFTDPPRPARRVDRTEAPASKPHISERESNGIRRFDHAYLGPLPMHLLA